MKQLTTKILGFLVIAFTLLLSPLIYTANSAIGSANLTNMTALEAIQPFGALIIILGLLFSGGALTYAGIKGGGTAGRTQILTVVLSIVGVVIILSMFVGLIITPMNTLISAATDAGDSSYIAIYGIIPLLVYVAVIAGAGLAQYKTYKSVRKGSKGTAARAQW